MERRKKGKKEGWESERKEGIEGRKGGRKEIWEKGMIEGVCV